MSGSFDSMSPFDAVQSLLILMEWRPPEGIAASVAASISPDRPGERIVNVILTAVAGRHCIVNVTGVPDRSSMESLTALAARIMEDAWDEPACIGIGPAASGPHPIYDITRFGRDS